MTMWANGGAAGSKGHGTELWKTPIKSWRQIREYGSKLGAFLLWSHSMEF